MQQSQGRDQGETRRNMVSSPSPDDTLTSFFSELQIPIEDRKVYSDAKINRLTSLFRRTQQPWSKVSHTYTVLRSLDRLDLLKGLIDVLATYPLASILQSSHNPLRPKA